MKGKLLIAVCIFLLALVACQKEATTNSTTKASIPLITVTPTFIAPPNPTDGFGTSNKELNGTPISFPIGVTLNGVVRTSNYGCTGNSYIECPTYGTLPFYMSFHNSNNTPTTVIFPAGTVLPSGDTILQGAVLVQPDTVTLAPNSFTCVNLNAFCVNETRTFNEDTIYGSPLISHNVNLSPLIDLLATKKTVTSYSGEVIQQAVWDIANTGRLTQADMTAINALP